MITGVVIVIVEVDREDRTSSTMAGMALNYYV
jgi:hypothetical protein